MKKSMFVMLKRKDYNFLVRLAKSALNWEQGYFAGNADMSGHTKEKLNRLKQIRKTYE